MCQPSGVCDVENDGKDSDARPKERIDDNQGKKRIIYMEEALGKTKFGKFNYFLIVISGIILNSVLMETLGISYVLPVSQCDLNLTTQGKGILGAVSFLGIITSSHLWGFLADTKGRRRVIKPTLLIAFILTVCSTLTNNFYVFVILRYFNGFFISGSSATIYAYLGEFHDNRQRGRAIMGSALIFGITCLLLPVIAWSVINQEWEFYVPYVDVVYKPWRLFMIVCGLPSFTAFIALIFLPESPKFVLSNGNQADAIKILQQMNRWNNGKNEPLDIQEICEEPADIENRKRILENKNRRFPLLKSIWDQTAQLFKPPYLRTTLLACTIQFGMYVTSGGLYMWLPEILNRMATNLDDLTSSRIYMCEVINLNVLNGTAAAEPLTPDANTQCVTKLEISTLEQTIVLEILYAVGFAIIGALINAVGKFVILFTVLTVSGLAGVLSIMVNIPILSISLFIALECCGLGINVLNAATIELYPTNLRAMAICISLMMGRVGCVVGANVVAILVDNHCEMVFVLSGALQIVCGLLAFFVPNIHRKTPKKALRSEPRLSITSRIT